ncbi:MAG: endonuclease/exonuclease/phosphatase family protein [Planctomycetota bacterium]|nr:endonuclease/exonuclease/phosphatase family protein [Planctomycetota bacterium]
MNRPIPRGPVVQFAIVWLLFSSACADQHEVKNPTGATSAGTSKQPNAAAKIRIGTWNIEHLGSRSKFQNRAGAPPDRTPAEVAQVASFIEQMAVDVLAVQEIANPAALQRLLKHLAGSYRFALGTTGVYDDTRISVGFLWNSTRVKLLHCGEMTEFPRKVGDLSVFHRKPVNATFRTVHADGSPGFDFRAITVHLKASQGSKNERKRSTETKILADYLRELASDSEEDQDVVVLGDFNHTYGAPACEVFTAEDLVQYAYPGGDRKLVPTIVWFDEPIDHIALTKGIRDEVVAGSLRVHNQLVDWSLQGAALTASKAAWRTVYSDHFPVTLDLQSGRDLDPNAQFASAGQALEIGLADNKRSK